MQLSAAECDQRNGVSLESRRVGRSLHATETYGNRGNLRNGKIVQKRENTRRSYLNEIRYGNDKSQWPLGTVRAGQGPEGPGRVGQSREGLAGPGRAGQSRG